MKIFEKAYFTQKGYYASNYAKTYEEIRDIHTECKDSPIIFEVIISGQDCPDQAIDHYCEHLIASYQHMVVSPWIYFRPKSLELWVLTDNGWTLNTGDIVEEAENLVASSKVR